MSLVNEVMVTSIDNPYNPFLDWDEWFQFDLSMGYHTCERLASIAYSADTLSDEENFEAVSEAIDELLKFGCINKKGEFVEYKKVFKYPDMVAKPQNNESRSEE